MIIKTQSKEYKIIFKNTDKYNEIIENILTEVNFSCCVLITEKGVPFEYCDKISQELKRKNIEVVTISLENIGEKNKSLSVCEGVLEEIFAKTKPTRDLVLIGIGGGVIGDLAGFVASILLRGVRFVQIPTTLLSMTDSSIGGKTGVNGFGAKNVIGTFKQPDLVLINSYFLKTLTQDQYLSGYCEIIKHAIIDNLDNFFEFLLENEDKIANLDIGFMENVIKKSCKIKANIVQLDELETLGIRSFLNFGHTIGHAIEKLPSQNEKILHGMAVGLGMILELEIAEKIGTLNDLSLKEKLTRHFKAIGLPFDLKSLANDAEIASKMIEKMTLDKKNSRSQTGKIQISFAIPTLIGEMKNIKIDEGVCRKLLLEIL